MSALYHKFLLLSLILVQLISLPAPLSANGVPDSIVTALLSAIILSSLCSYFKGKLSQGFLLFYCAAALVWEPLFPFLALAAYDCTGYEQLWLRFLWLLPLLAKLPTLEPSSWLSCALLTVLAVFLRVQDNKYQSLLHKYHQVRDDTTETALLLKQKNQELMKNQDYEVALATLTERNRIAREIHDNVGHLLTRSILQVSALQVIYSKDEAIKEQLASVRATLSDAMDNVRSSVHNLHEESIDLRHQLTRLVEDFTFCPVTLTFDSGPLPMEMNYAVIAIVKEALSNIARHSNASKASVRLIEHPSIYQLIIHDNGTRFSPPGKERTEGIGLSNMEERIRNFHGVFHIDQSRGFKIFISIPKLPKAR